VWRGCPRATRVWRRVGLSLSEAPEDAAAAADDAGEGLLELLRADALGMDWGENEGAVAHRELHVPVFLQTDEFHDGLVEDERATVADFAELLDHGLHPL